MSRGRLLWALMLTAAGLFFVGLAADLYWLRMVTKPWPALLLMATVWTSSRSGARQPYGRLVAIGLGFSALGDLLLEASSATFLPGVGAFLLAHVAYIGAFFGAENKLRPMLGLPFAAWGLAVVWWLRPGLEAAGMLVPVAVYTAVICAMMWRAAACWIAKAPRATWAFVGALLFAASDTLIAVSRFSELEVPYVRWAIMILYWLGQVLIACSLGGDAGE